MNENKDEKDCEKNISVEDQKFADFSKVQKRQNRYVSINSNDIL